MNILTKAIVNHFYKPLFPLGVVLDLTDKCNLSCGYCDIGIAHVHGLKRPSRELSAEQIDEIIGAMNTLSVRHLYISGGEPFLSKNIWYLLDKCKDNKILVDGITTNGTLLDRLTDDEIQRLNSARVRRIIISLDFADPHKHDAVRGQKGLSEKILSFLRSRRSDTIKAKFSISTVITKDNYADLSSIVELCHTTGKITHINFQPVCLDNIFVDYAAPKDAKEKLAISEVFLDDLDDQIERALKTSRALGMSTSLPFLKIWIRSYFENATSGPLFFNSVMKGFVCSRPYNYLHINYNGDMLACNLIGPCGNIHESSIQDMWKNNAAKYREIMRNGQYFSRCRSCFCNFGSNYRYSLVYKPIANFRHTRKIVFYFLRRYLNKA